MTIPLPIRVRPANRPPVSRLVPGPLGHALTPFISPASQFSSLHVKFCSWTSCKLSLDPNGSFAYLPHHDDTHSPNPRPWRTFARPAGRRRRLRLHAVGSNPRKHLRPCAGAVPSQRPAQPRRGDLLRLVGCLCRLTPRPAAHCRRRSPIAPGGTQIPWGPAPSGPEGLPHGFGASASACRRVWPVFTTLSCRPVSAAETGRITFHHHLADPR